MKLAVVVQRYGADISGGAELHARYIAEHLAAHADVRVLTTCARDYVTWRNDFLPGVENVRGIAVERFLVDRQRDTGEFGRRSALVFDRVHTIDEELLWLLSEGPVCRSLITRLQQSRDEFDFVLIFSVRYYTAYHAARAVPQRAVLVPTAEREASIGLQIFQPIFRGVRAIIYNSPEERAMINTLSGNSDVPGDVVGVGSEVPQHTDTQRMRSKYGLHKPFVIYVGRIDVNKGCAELFDFFLAYLHRSKRELELVLIGSAELSIPTDPRIRHLGFVSDSDKFDAIAAAEALIMPSYFESLSMVALEAWALGRPVLANAHCDVLVGQSRRSNAGLYYANALEFAAALDALLDDRSLAAALGDNGRLYFQRNYAWPVIEGKYLNMFARLQETPAGRAMESMPGWRERRARTAPPAAEVVRAVPEGAVLSDGGAQAARKRQQAEEMCP